MAKKKKTQKTARKPAQITPRKTPQKTKEFYAGWWFYGAVTLVLIIPFTWMSWQVRRDDIPAAVSVMIAVTAAAICASVITWIANEIVHYFQRRSRKAAKKR